MVSEVDPLDFANVTLGVNGLVTAASPAAVKLVAQGVKDLILTNEEGLSEVPFARGGVLGDFGPNLVGLVLAAGRDVDIALEVLAILGSDSGDEKRRSE